MRFQLTALSLLSLTLLSSCADSTGKAPFTGLSQNETIMADGSNIDGVYATEIWPVNYNLNLKKIGTTAIERHGDEFSSFVNMEFAPRGIQIRQGIYTGRRCPNLNDDLNKDAYIDIQEALIAIGHISIPLDGNLDSQQAGIVDLPVGNEESGAYSYHETTSFQRLFADLKVADENPNDNIIKLGASEGLTFPGRIVLFQGLKETVFLPASVQGAEGLSAHQSLPIGCGVLWKVETNPITQ